MSRVYDNWERLVAAVMKKQQLWELFHQHSRTPSTCSESSSTSFNDVPFDFSRLKEELKIKKASTDHEKSFHTLPRPFTFRELAAATKDFRPDLILSEDEFGRLYKGRLKGSKQIVAVKQIGLQGDREWLVEVLMLSLLHHPNMLNLIGYCADGDHRLLVHEYMPFGSLDDHLHGLQPEKAPLDWNTRIKIAVGVAKCLAYMHEKANPPVIHRNVTSSNILLGEGYHPKLSHFGLAKLGPVDETKVFTTVKGTYGYCAPEYAMTGRLTVKADVYSYGIVLLEIITGRKAIDNSRAVGETDLVLWTRLLPFLGNISGRGSILIPSFKHNAFGLIKGGWCLLPRIKQAHPLFGDQRKFVQMADPMLQGRYPIRGLYQALGTAAMCLQIDPDARPSMADVATVINYLASHDSPLAD